MPLTLYYNALSQPSRAVLQLLQENNISFEKKHIDLRTGEQKKPEFLKLNPNGYVPVIEDDGFVLYESMAILQYICNKYKLDSWYPADLHIRARTDMILHWQHTAIRAIFTPLTRSVLTRDEAKAAELKLKAPASLQVLENLLAESKTAYVCTKDHPTIADLALLHELNGPELFGLYDFSAYPLISRWLTLMSQRPISLELIKPLEMAKQVLLHSQQQQQQQQPATPSPTSASAAATAPAASSTATPSS